MYTVSCPAKSMTISAASSRMRDSRLGNGRPAVFLYWRGEHFFEFFAGDSFYFQEPQCHCIQFVSVLDDDRASVLVCFTYQFSDFFINFSGNIFRVITLLRNLTSQEDQFFFLTIYHRSKF